MRHSLLQLLTIALCLSYTDMVWGEDGNSAPPLDERERRIVTIAAHTASGDLSELQRELAAGLDAGLTINESKEILVHLYAYSGFPRSIRGLQTLMAVLEERQTNGISDNPGRDASEVTDPASRYERGLRTVMEITGRSEDQLRSGYAEFSPEIERFLKEHLFADLFERDVLTYEQREIATISALISMQGVDPMLRGHFNVGLNVGLTPEQLSGIVSEFESLGENGKATAAAQVLAEVFESRDLNSPSTLETTPPREQQLLELSAKKWHWMADRNLEELEALFQPDAVFVHMGATMDREQELEVIRSGNIQYKKTDIEEASVRFTGETAIVLNKIKLLAVVGGQEVTNPFVVTEVYVQDGDAWKLASLSFTKIRY